MPDVTQPTPKEQLQKWFQWLQALQNAAELVAPAASALTLGQFANSTITDVLADDTVIDNFINALTNKTPYPFTVALLKQSSTFESLLEHAATIPTIGPFANYLASCLSTPFSTMSWKQLSASLLSAVFPKGPNDPAWTAFQNGLISSLPSSCYSATQQNKVKTILIDPASTVLTLLNQLIQLG
jgi:hypothetical protein